MKNTYVLFDTENIFPDSVTLPPPANTHILMFLSASKVSIPLPLASSLQSYGPSASYIPIEGKSANNMDFHIAAYVGEIAAKDHEACIRIISNDTGYDGLIHHYQQRGISIDRLVTLPTVFTLKDQSIDLQPAKTSTPNLLTNIQSVTTESAYALRICKLLFEREQSLRPAKLPKLLSYIEVITGKVDNTAQNVLRLLVGYKIVINDGKSLTYDFSDHKLIQLSFYDNDPFNTADICTID